MMETVNSMASAAAKAVWGENKQNGPEPISGQTGDTSKGEPYDAGNIEDPKAQAALAEANGDTSGETTGQAPRETNGSSERTQDAQFAKHTGTAAESSGTPDNPSTNLKLKSGAGEDTTKDQNDTRDPANPRTNPKSAPTDVNDAGAGDGPNEAQKLEGPGPRPVDEVARENGGDAGNVGRGAASESNGGRGAGAGEEDGEEEEEEEEDGPNAKSKGERTGEKYVRSSGLKADGGDFDATKPGAGKEADRLMEEKGIHGGQNANGDAHGDGDKKEKKSIGKKIKDKLHRH